MKFAPFVAVLVILGAAASHAAAPTDPRIEAIIDRMTPRQRVAQLLFVGFSGTRMNDEIRRLVVDWRVGALAIYSRNVNSATELRALTSQLRALPGGEVMPLIAVDQAGGEVARIADEVPQLPGEVALGATRSVVLARRAGRAVGSRLSRLGITLNLAPVVDVADPGSPLGIRAFSANPELAGTLGAAFIRGEREGGMASTAKHFPGIGTVGTDSHDELPVLAATSAELERVHFAPFRAAIEAGVDVSGNGHAPFHRDILGAEAVQIVHQQHGSFLLPQAYPEGAPSHPSYPAGHAVIAGACVTVLKAVFAESWVLPQCFVPSADGNTLEPYHGAELTVGGELDKLAQNIAFGRNFAGIHWWSDGIEGIRLGEEFAIRYLREAKLTANEFFHGFSLTRFDGAQMTI